MAVATVIHEWRYFAALDLDMFAVVKATDLLSLSINWAPLPAVALVIGALINVALSVQEKGLTDEQIVADSDSPAKTRSLRKWADRVPFLTSSVFLLHMFMLGPAAYSVVPYLGFLWLSFGPIVPGKTVQRLGRRYGGGLLLTIYLAPPLLIAIPWGIADYGAVRDAKSEVGQHTVVLDDSSVLSDALILRSLDRGLLVRLPAEQRTELVPWSRVTGISSALPSWDGRSRLCKWFNINCFPSYAPVEPTAARSSSDEGPS